MAKDQRLHVRLTAEERETLNRVTEQLGLTHISEAVRVLVQRAADQQAPQTKTETPHPAP